MDEIIRQTLIESGYEETSNSISYFQKDHAAYFFTIRLSEDELLSIKNKDLLNESEAYSALLIKFNNIVKEGNDVAIEKNSSLIILVECEDISAVLSFQQQILLIEEDEYFFKKYVILYTTESVEVLATTAPIIPVLTNKLHNNEQFEIFATQGAINEISEYITILQLYIKLPFLKLDFENQVFKTLDQKITEILGNDINLFNQLIENTVKIEEMDFTLSENEEEVNALIRSLSND